MRIVYQLRVFSGGLAQLHSDIFKKYFFHLALFSANKKNVGDRQMLSLVNDVLSFVQFDGVRLPFKKRTLTSVQNRKPFMYFHDNSKPSRHRRDSTENIETAIIFIAHCGLWHPDVWEVWRGDQPIEFFIHKDQHEWKFQFSKEYGNIGYTVPPVSVERGTLSHVKAILNSLRFAKDTIPTLKRFFIFSGDSIPVKNIDKFLSYKGSVLSFQFENIEEDFTFVKHNMEMMLSRKHVDFLTTSLHEEIESGSYTLDDERARAHNNNRGPPAHMLDEYVIGSYLYNAGYRFRNRTIAGWIAVNDPESTLNSIELRSETQTIECDSAHEIIMPDSEDGEKQIVVECLNVQDIANNLLFGIAPFDEFLVFRKISREFTSFATKLKDSFLSRPVLPIGYKSAD